MNKYLKLVCIVLSLFILVSMVACGQSASPSTQKSNTDTVKTETAKEKTPSEPIKLKVFITNGDDTRKAIFEKYIKVNAKKEFPNYEIEYELGGSAGDYSNKLKAYNAAGELPDVFWAYGGAQSEPVINAGNALDLTPYIKKDGFYNKYKSEESIAPWKDGKIYAVNGGIDFYFQPRIFVNKDLFAKYNLDLPKTFDDFLAVSKVFNQNGIIPFSVFGKGGEGVLYFLVQSLIMADDPQVYKDIISNKTDWSNKVCIDAFNRIQKMTQEKVFAANAPVLEYAAAKELFTSKKAAMYTSGSWELPSLAADPNVDFIPWPSVNTRITDTNVTVQYWGMSQAGYSVFSKSKHVDEAVKFAEFCATQDAMQITIDDQAPCALDIGVIVQPKNQLMVKHIQQFDASKEKLPGIANVFSTKMFSEFGVLCNKLLVKGYSGEQFAKDIEKTWAENFK